MNYTAKMLHSFAESKSRYFFRATLEFVQQNIGNHIKAANVGTHICPCKEQEFSRIV